MTAVALSSLSAVTWTNTSDGLPLPAATLNSGINNIDALGNNLLTVAQQQEAMWASVAASAPTDKPAGKIWFQTDNKVWLGYPTANGTPLPLISQASATPTYSAPDVAARTLGIVGLDSTNSNTALTSTSSQAVGAILTLPANALNANGRAYRATFYMDSNNASNTFTAVTRFNGTTFLTFASPSQASVLVSILTITRISATQYVWNIQWYNTGGTYSTAIYNALPAVIVGTVTNWTSAINFDVDITAWTNGTVRSLIIGEQIG